MKILVLGTSGMIGHRLWLELSQFPELELVSVTRGSFPDILKKTNQSPVIYENIDVTNFKRLVDVLDKEKPEIIINAIGVTIRKLKEILSFDLIFEINSLFPKRLQKWVQKNDSKLIHLSTDCVFSGQSGAYTELSIPDSCDLYGKSKFLGELEGESVLTLRFSAIGREISSHTELLDWFLLQKGKTIEGYTNVIYSGITTTVLASEIRKIIFQHSNLQGLYQISSNAISKYELLSLINMKFGNKVNILKNHEKKSDKTLDCSKYKMKTGFTCPSWDLMIDELSQEKCLNYSL